MTRTTHLFLPLILAAGLTEVAAGEWRSCLAISDDAQRLACYDKHARSLAGQPEATALEQKKQEFGLPAKVPSQEIDAITSTITRVETFSRGKRRITLDNGQVWRQVGGSSRPRLEVGDRIAIERAALGSFLLKKEGSNRSLRVRRVE